MEGSSSRRKIKRMKLFWNTCIDALGVGRMKSKEKGEAVNHRSIEVLHYKIRKVFFKSIILVTSGHLWTIRPLLCRITTYDRLLKPCVVNLVLPLCKFAPDSSTHFLSLFLFKCVCVFLLSPFSPTSSLAGIPTDPFTIFKPENPSIDDSELNKVHRPTDFEALKLRKGRSGCTHSRTREHPENFLFSPSWFILPKTGMNPSATRPNISLSKSHEILQSRTFI